MSQLARTSRFQVSRWVFWIGLALVLAYWYGVHPWGFARGYTEDWCQPDMTRQMIAESLEKFGAPRFFSEAYRAPDGISLPYMPWAVELSWLGSYVWKWNRDFPFLWVYFGVSLAVSYLGIGAILRKMRLSPVSAWGLATAAVLLNVPRHFKIWHHYEHLLQHWVYLGVFLDAWIWQRFARDRRWSWSLEMWRGFCLVGVLGTAGYFWGPMIVEWCVVRAAILGVELFRRKRGEPTRIEGSWRQALPPAVATALLLVIDAQWFIPWVKESQSLGTVFQQLGWFAHLSFVLRPLWWDRLIELLQATVSPSIRLSPVNQPETVVTAGWFFWIPAILGVYGILRQKGARGLVVVLPWVALLGIALAYATPTGGWIQPLLQALVPPMKFFRVASRWGLFLPAFLVALIALSWPELSAWGKGLRERRPRYAAVWAMLFCLFSLAEASMLLKPVSTMPPLSESASRLLENVRTSPGTTVLDMPFCLAGGNGVCTGAQCPNYPESTAGGCFRGWHDKKVYGIYASRLVESQCELYRQAPYASWFDAWGSQRCFSETEWSAFCDYLDQHAELSAVLVYPDIWRGAGSPECQAQFARHLGDPVEEASFVTAAVRGSETPRFTRLLRYPTRCRVRSP